MNLDEHLPELLRYPRNEAVPVSAERVIAGAHRRVHRRVATTGAAALLLAATGALLANQPSTSTATVSPILHSPVYHAALGEQVPVATGARLWLTKTGVCESHTSPSAEHCIASTTQSGLAAPDSYLDHNVSLKVAFMGTYVGPEAPASIVLSTDRTTVATLVTNPNLHGEVGYFAYLPWPPAKGGYSGSPNSLTFTYRITVNAYDSAGHILSTITTSVVTTVDQMPPGVQ
jgi:hypothetical protein